MAKQGRPAREPSKAEREKVKELLGAGAKITRVAKLLNMSLPTFRKYFPSEILAQKKPAADAVPPFKATKAMRDDVILMTAIKERPEVIARAIGCTLEQLEHHFKDELDQGRARYRLKVAKALDQQMEDGVIGATNRLEALTQASDPEAPAKSAAYVGKKVAAAAAATAAASAGGRFAPRPAPKLAVVNGEAVRDDDE